MAKIVKKKTTVIVNPRSRAAKRASSPSINVDKSIKDAPRVTGTSPMLGVSANSGISKKKKSKQMTRGQRMRQEKGLARAEAVMDQMEKKVDGAKAKTKKRSSRKALWEDVNDSTVDEQRKTSKAPGRSSITAEGQGQENQGEQPEQDQSDIDMGGAPNISAFSTLGPIEEETAAQLGVQQPYESLSQEESDLIS